MPTVIYDPNAIFMQPAWRLEHCVYWLAGDPAPCGAKPHATFQQIGSCDHVEVAALCIEHAANWPPYVCEDCRKAE